MSQTRSTRSKLGLRMGEWVVFAALCIGFGGYLLS